jgi:hypothetical protein
MERKFSDTQLPKTEPGAEIKAANCPSVFVHPFSQVSTFYDWK